MLLSAFVIRFNTTEKVFLSKRPIYALVGAVPSQERSQNAEKLCTSKGDYWIKQWFSSIRSLFKVVTSFKGKNLLPEGTNSFLKEQFLIEWKITFTTLGDLP